jgi:hypothetical protein
MRGTEAPTVRATTTSERVGPYATLRSIAASRAEPAEAARAALLACLIVCLAQAAYVVLDAPVFGFGAVTVLDGLHAALAGALALGLMLRPPRRSSRCDLAFLAIALPYLPIFWLAELQGGAMGLVREPLLGHKIVILGMAVLAPSSLWLGAGLIAGFAVHAALLLASLHTHGHRLVGVTAEPWVTFLFAAVAIAYLGSRANRRTMMQRLAHLRAEARANRRLARLFLTLRDRANTPLQTLELGTALLERRLLPAEARVLQALRGSIARLRDLSAELPTAPLPPEGAPDAPDALEGRPDHAGPPAPAASGVSPP